MDELRGCLAWLPRLQRQLLTLRAGLYGRPRSTGTTARILHLNRRREQRLEHRALTALQALTDTGCAGPARSAGASPGAGSAMFVSGAPGLSDVSGEPGTDGAAGIASPGIKTAAGSGTAHHRRHRGGTVVTSGGPGRVERAGAGASVPAALIGALAALMIGAGLMAAPAVRRRLLLVPAAAALGRRTAPDRHRRAATAAGAGSPVPAAKPTPSVPPAPAPPLWKGQAEMDPEIAGAAAAAFAEFTSDPETKSPTVAAPAAEVAAPAGSTAPGSRRWLQDHAAETALMATAVAGGVVRALARWRARRRRQR